MTPGLNNPAWAINWNRRWTLQSQAILTTCGIPGAQHGTLDAVAVSNPFGRVMRVGENGTDEGIFPLPPGLLDALRRGGSARPAGRVQDAQPLVIKLGDRTLADLIVKGNSIVERESRGN